jgi:choline dehydrogenase-like flavoprotein
LPTVPTYEDMPAWLAATLARADRAVSRESPELSPEELKIGLAIAEAMIPGGGRVLPADERTVRYAAKVAFDTAPPALAAFVAALRLMDRAAIVWAGRSFHKLSRSQQLELLDRWYLDPVMRAPLSAVAFAVKFMHFDKGRGFVDRRPLDVVQSLEEPAWLSQIHRGDDWKESDFEVDVVVVGTGAGGAVVGRELADRGLAVVFVEEGKHYRRDAFGKGSVDAHFRFYRSALVLGPSAFPIHMGRLVGGSTAINTGSSFRTPDHVLHAWCERIGTDEFRPDRMRRHFERVEQVLEVQPPSRKHMGPIADVIDRAAGALGWSHGPILRNAVGCEGQGFCDFGCPTDARRSTNLSYIPPALKKGAVVLTELRAERVTIEGGRAVGIEAVTASGKRIRIRAQATILACGAIPTPVLLSKQGLCGSSGQLGRNLSIHPSGGLSALMDEPIRGRDFIPQPYCVDEFVRDGILISAAQSGDDFSGIVFPYVGRWLMETLDQQERIASFGVLVRDDAQQGRIMGSVHGAPMVAWAPTPADVDRMHRGLVLAGELALAAGAKVLYPTVLGQPPVRTHADWKRFKKRAPDAAQLMLISYHPLGTARMGKDPRTSVVGLDHQTHEVPGLFLVDGSTVPGPLGVNPQITIMAMATRAAEHIAEWLGAGEAALAAQ